MARYLIIATEQWTGPNEVRKKFKVSAPNSKQAALKVAKKLAKGDKELAERYQKTLGKLAKDAYDIPDEWVIEAHKI